MTYRYGRKSSLVKKGFYPGSVGVKQIGGNAGRRFAAVSSGVTCHEDCDGTSRSYSSTGSTKGKRFRKKTRRRRRKG